MWCVELSPGDTIKVGNVTLTLKDKTGKRARIVVRNEGDSSAILIPRTISGEALDIPGKQPLAQTD